MRLVPLLILLVLAGCRVESPGGASSASDTLAVAPDTLFESPSTPLPPVADAAGRCTLVAADSVALYTRASSASERFGTLAPGDSATAGGRVPGWIGIEPGTAQAANVGPFRLRYASAEGDFELRGDCDALPVQPRLDPQACYEMAQSEVRLHVRPDTASAAAGAIPAQGFAVATRRTPTGWLRVRVGENGPPGWVAPDDVNLNGPACDAL